MPKINPKFARNFSADWRSVISSRRLKRVEQTLTAKREMGHCKACEMWTLKYPLFGKSPK